MKGFEILKENEGGKMRQMGFREGEKVQQTGGELSFMCYLTNGYNHNSTPSNGLVYHENEEKKENPPSNQV